MVYYCGLSLFDCFSFHNYPSNVFKRKKSPFFRCYVSLYYAITFLESFHQIWHLHYCKHYLYEQKVETIIATTENKAF
jgi:hypothetical protein